MQMRSPLLTLALAAMVIFLAIQGRRDRELRESNRRLAEQIQNLGTDRPRPLPALPGRIDAAPRPLSEGTLVYRQVSPSVVSVANNAIVRRGFFDVQLYEVPQGTGTGFVWDKKGHIVSNYHVVHQANTLTVTFPDGPQYAAKLIGVAPDYDLAVLKIEAPAERLNPVSVGISKALEVGQPVYAIGNPFGLDTTLSAGIVSALGRTITSMTERKIKDVIQTDAMINPGNSGGPLLTGEGLLVGVNTAILSPSGASAGIGFAVPSDTVSRVVPQLIEKGHVTRSGLGVELLPDHISRRSGVKGVALYAVPENSPASRAGLTGLAINRWGTSVRFGDVIVEVDGKRVKTVEDLRAILDPHKPGERVELTVVRNGKQRKVKMPLIEEAE